MFIHNIKRKIMVPKNLLRLPIFAYFHTGKKEIKINIAD